MLKHHSELKLIAHKEFKEHDDLYKIVDFLNKSLKSEGLIFGLSKQRDNNINDGNSTEGKKENALEVNRISIYKAEENK